MAIKKVGAPRNMFREKIVLITGIVTVLVVGVFLYQNNRSGATTIGAVNPKSIGYPVYISGVRKAIADDPYVYHVNIWAQPSTEHETLPGSGVEGGVLIAAGAGKGMYAKVFAYTPSSNGNIAIDAIMENQRKIRCNIAPTSSYVSVGCSYYPVAYDRDWVNPIPISLALDPSSAYVKYPNRVAKLTVDPVAGRPMTRKLTLTIAGKVTSSRNFYYYCDSPTNSLYAIYKDAKDLTTTHTCDYYIKPKGTYTIKAAIEDNNAIVGKTTGRFEASYNKLEITDKMPAGPFTIILSEVED